ncbi:TPA: GNAT family N-acetyltransferase [Streptococcus suis]
MTIWKELAAFAEMETPRLYLRPLRFSDVEDFYQLVSDPENLAFVFPAILDKEEATEALVREGMQAPLGVWGMEDKEKGCLIGMIRFEKIQEGSRQAEIGYLLRKDFRGKGLMTEALKTLVFLAFNALQLRELALVTHEENRASQAVAKRAGFQLIRSYKGSDRYSHKVRKYCLFGLSQTSYQQLTEEIEEKDDYH